MIPSFTAGLDSLGIFTAAIVPMITIVMTMRYDIRYCRIQNQRNPEVNFVRSSCIRDETGLFMERVYNNISTFLYLFTRFLREGIFTRIKVRYISEDDFSFWIETLEYLYIFSFWFSEFHTFIEYGVSCREESYLSFLFTDYFYRFEREYDSVMYSILGCPRSRKYNICSASYIFYSTRNAYPCSVEEVGSCHF